MKMFILSLNFLVLILLHPFSGLVSQEAPNFGTSEAFYGNQINGMDPADSIALLSLPVLQGAASPLPKNTLPAILDNSSQPFFRPLFEQVASECGQYSSIGFVFTYEYNYVNNTPANVPENQFPTHYTYNFMNGGFGWHGVSYFHSFEIVKTNGHPTVADFGTNNTCGPSYWLSGYDKYYQGMSHKLDEVFQINVSDEAGLLLLKNWLHNHAEGQDVGGLACFYSATPWNLNQLPAESPEAGKKVITTFLHPATHAATITGYHDSIRYDYNQDGMFTNHIDINDDGMVDMRDWEIGGLKFTDSYLGGINWADSGFCYMMYKTLADKVGEGGIWNHAVHVVKVKEDYTPQLTLKTKLRHSCRGSLKLVVGVSNGTDSQVPERTLGFPIFDYQGACQFMQGGWDPGNDTLELGLDITPLLGHIRSMQEATFFLLVYEDDPIGQGSGEILTCAVVDYNNEGTEIPSLQTNVPILNNDLTTVKINALLNFNELTIETESLPQALTGEYYEKQMHAAGGTPPLQWTLVKGYEEHTGSSPYPPLDGAKLDLPDTVHSQVLQPLGFEFPFYGEAYDSIWIHSDGFILFDDRPYPWPYLYDEHLMIRQTKLIAPFLNANLFADTTENSGIWFKNNSDHASISWRMHAKFPAGAFYTFTLQLYHDGSIQFFYGDEPDFSLHTWASGISLGNGKSYQYSGLSGPQAATGVNSILFTNQLYPHELTLTPDGKLSGIPLQNYPGVDLCFDVEDDAGLHHRKTFQFHSYVAGVKEQKPVVFTSLHLWPNPADEQVQVDFQLADKRTFSIELMDAGGRAAELSRPAAYAAGRHTLSLKLGKYRVRPKGACFLVFKDGKEVIHAQKIILLP